MAIYDVSSIAKSNLTDAIPEFEISKKALDESEETCYDNPNWEKWHGYYRKIPELRTSINALATWTLGKGFDCDSETRVILDYITGWGEDTFQSILWQMLVIKKINGDAYAEIIRDDKTNLLLNLKPLNPGNVKVYTNKKGIISKYEYTTKNQTISFKPNEIFHIVNERIGNENHGVSIIEACEDVILIRNEALDIMRKSIRRNIYPLKIVHVDTDSTAKIQDLINTWENVKKDYEMLFVPFGTIPKVDIIHSTLNINDMIGWIKYLGDFFYEAVGVPKVIIGGSSEFTEASSKTAYLTFEQVYSKEQEELEADIWNQLYLKIKFRKPASLRSEMLSSEEKNTRQIGFQPNDVIAGRGQ